MSGKIPGGLTLAEILPPAQAAGYAVPAFNPRYRACIRPLVEAAVECRSPLIVEISQRELGWFQWSPRQVREELERVVTDLETAIPFALHLDHAWEMELVQEAIEAGFTSVMIDASRLPFEENVAATRQVVAYAHDRGVSVEAELGRLTTTDRLESENDEEWFTDPAEAGEFVARTGCDALAVSVGTAHGVYRVKNPRIDLPRLAAIRREVGHGTALVLHGGSGLPAPTVHQAISLPGGGISKMNIATDLENALLRAMGGLTRMTSGQLDALPSRLRSRGLAAVKAEATTKIRDVICSQGRAWAVGP